MERRSYLASAKEHVPEIERKIQVIKERVRAVIYSIPFNSLPTRMLVHTVLFVTKQLNLFPVKGGLSLKLSPKQIMSGEVVHYKLVQWALAGTVVGHLELYRTHVLLYSTDVLLVRPTNVRR